MDVRCKYCHVEYEVDGDRAAAGSVIQCINCGLPVQIRGTAEADVEDEVAEEASAEPAPAPELAPEPAPTPEPAPAVVEVRAGDDVEESDPDDATEESDGVPAPGPPPSGRTTSEGPARVRQWLVREPGGEVRPVPELTTLQKWIFTGLVTREWEISIGGDTWKPLGNIGELEPFFGFAEEAHQAWDQSGPHKAPPRPPPRRPAVGEREDSAVELDFSELEEIVSDDRPRSPRAATMQGMPPPVPPAPPISLGGWGLTGDEDVFDELHPELASLAGPAPVPEQPPEPVLPELAIRDTPEPEKPITEPSERRSWTAVAVITVVAAVAVYWFGFRDRGQPRDAAIARPRVVDRAQAPPEPMLIDAAVTPSAAEAVAMARNAILAGDEAALRDARLHLGEQPGATSDPELLATRSRVAAALAQVILDRATTAGKTDAKDREVDTLTAEAVARADQGLALATRDPTLTVARANGLRLNGAPTSEVRKLLGVHGGDPIEVALVRAALYERDGDLRRARRTAEEVVADADAAGDPRPRFRIALARFRANELSEAESALGHLLEERPNHAGGKALKAAIAAARERQRTQPVVAVTPQPPRDDTFVAMVHEAEQKADDGDCTGALAIYRRARALKPSSITVLNGMGYCYIDGRRFASAHASFNEALSISRNNADSLVGIAEAYTQQGLEDQAIRVYQRLLATKPGGTYGKIARRQIKELGGVIPPPPAPEKVSKGDGAADAGAEAQP